MSDYCLRIKKTSCDTCFRPLAQWLVIVIGFCWLPTYATPPTPPAQRPKGAAAGYQSVNDCNYNGVPDSVEIANGRFFESPLPGLIGAYGGIIGTAHTSAYDFGRDFLIVHQAWLRLQGTADPFVPYPVDLGLHVRLNNGPTEEMLAPGLDQYEICIPVQPTTVATGSVALSILIGVCCDHISVIEEATLWFDAVPMPPPQDLRTFAELQNCFQSPTDSSLCDDSDIDWDADIDLNDLNYFLQVLDGP